MSEIRKLDAGEAEQVVRIMAQAYPGFGFNTEEAKKRLKERYAQVMREDQASGFYGLFRENRLLGAMRLFDFTLNLHGTRIFAGGVGSVAVDLLHKKEKVAKELVTFFLRHYRERGASTTLLYPFRVDFYKQMGFGLGTKMNQYSIRPESLPNRGTKQHLVYLQKDDKEELVACYNRYADKTHGMIEKNEYECAALFDNPENTIVGCRIEGKLAGYLVFSFKKACEDNRFLNNMFVTELIYETPEALADLLTFLHSQADQINRIVMNTQDEYFHHLLSDPRNGTNNILPPVYHESNVSGVGLMYRIIDVPQVFNQLAKRSFNGQSCKLKLTIGDSFLEENEGSTVIHFIDGYPTVANGGEYEVEVQMDISDFSSLLLGAVPFAQLYTYGLAQLSNPAYISTLNKLFWTDAKPKCTTPF